MKHEFPKQNKLQPHKLWYSYMSNPVNIMHGIFPEEKCCDPPNAIFLHLLCSPLGIGSQIKSYCLTRNRQTQEWENGIISFFKMRFTLLSYQSFPGP